MSCNFKATKAGTSLKYITGSDASYFNALQSLVVNTVTDSNGEERLQFTKGFVDYYQSLFGEENMPKFDDSERGNLARTITNYYLSKHFNVSAQSNNTYFEESVKKFGYRNTHDKVFAMKNIGNRMRTFYINDVQKGIDINKERILNDLANRTTKWLTVQVLTDYFKNAKLKEDKAEKNKMFKSILVGDENKESYIEAIEKSLKKADYQDRNRFAVLKEILADKVKFFTEVQLSNPLIGEIAYKDESIDEEMEDIKSSIDDTEDSTKNNAEDEEGLTRGDYEQNHWEDSTALTNNFMKGFSSKIRTYLALVPKLTSVNYDINTENNKISYKYQYDRSNPLGFVDYIDLKNVIAVITSAANRETLTDFIESIKNAANIPGMEGLIKVYNDIKDNPDFAQQIKREFKNVITKYETRKDNDSVYMTKSNKNNNAEQVLSLSFLNDAKYTSVQIESDDTIKTVETISGKIKEYRDAIDKNDNLKSAKLYNEICNDLASRFALYYPSIDKNSIEAAIRCNGIDNGRTIISNMSGFNNTLITIANASKKCREKYEAKNNKLSELKKAKKEVETALREIYQIPEQENKKKIKELEDKLNIINNAITETYAIDVRDTSMVSATSALANILYKYSIVKLELNSRNAAGNLQSDLINSSMLTYLTNILNGSRIDDDGNKESLVNFGKFKFKGNQYSLSNILVEKTDEKGNTINYGLFYKDDDGTYKPTEYADQLLNIALFNGLSDPNTSDNLLYSEMALGDYVYTAFSNFFNSDENIDSDRKHTKLGRWENIPLANYFMRTPSDAPKTFIVRAPKYTIKGLFSISNKSDVDLAIDAYTNQKINKISYDDFKKEIGVSTPKFIRIDLNDKNTKTQILNDFSTYGIKRTVWNNQVFKTDRVNKVAYFGYEITDEEGRTSKYVIKGDLSAVNGDKITITNGKATLIESEKDIDFVTPIVRDDVSKTTYREGHIGGVVVNRSINKSHPIYQQFRNVFEQELTNMASFIDRYYETAEDESDPTLRTHMTRQLEGKDKGKPILKPGFDEETMNRTLYRLYHIGNGSKSHIEKVNGKWKFTGNLFTSDKFTIIDDNGNSINYGQRILDTVFNGLYGENIDNDLRYRKDVNGNIVIDYTDEQRDKIDEEISKFIVDYMNDNIRKMDKFKNLDVANIINDNNVVEFVLNYRLAYINFNDLFEGDAKFYKSSQDFLKRAKEGQAGGMSYGTFNLYQDLTARPVNLNPNESKLNSDAVQDKLTKLGLNVQQRTGFIGVTVKNTVKTTAEVAKNGPIAQHLSKIYQKEGMTKDEAIEAANNHMSGFENTTVNDAQSYITFEEWIRRIASRGQLDEYMPLIEAIQTNKPIPIGLLKKFVQVQKNFYYDIHYDAETNTHVPRQIKNAEFVLVPRFIKGTQLEDVYNAMKANNIDQLNTVETSKAGKARILELFDETTGEVTQEHLDDFNQNAGSFNETYYYEFLYTQQETPQHMNAANKAGIQIMKKILDNIKDEKTKDLFQSLYSKNIQESFKVVAEELSIPLNEDGSIQLDADGNIQGIDMNFFMNRLRKECMRQGLDSNMMEYFTLDSTTPLKLDGRPNTVMDTYMSNVMTKAQSVCQALFNSAVTRQTLPGFHAAQITNVGFSASNNNIVYKLTDAGKGRNLKDNLTKDEFNKLPKKNQIYYIQTKGQIGISKNLKYHPAVEGKTNQVHPYVEVMLPKSNFGFKRNEDGTYDKSDDELLKELQDEGLDQFIGYRIPTEGKQSICLMKVVGFIDDALGSTIVVPDNWVSQTGSDFDIDSVYGIQHSTYIDNTGKIRKIKYSEKPDIYDYANYINKHLDKINKIKDKSVKSKFEALQKELDDKFNELRQELSDEESAAYDKLSDESKAIIKEAHTKFKTNSVNAKTGKLTKDGYLEQLEFVANYLSKNKKELDDADKNFIDVHSDLVDAISNEYTDKRNYRNIKAKEILQDRIDRFNNKAKELGLMTYDEFIQSDPLDINSTKQRSNKIADIMIQILSSDEAFEENTGQSKFTDIIEARDSIIDSKTKNARKNRSCFDFLNQAEYQEDVMSGAKLKAFSVTRDTFCSVCNIAKPKIDSDNGIYIRYSNYSNEELHKRFDFEEEGISNVNDDNVVCHLTIGWTNDNKQVDGNILTSYSSETTAHILDAVKEGAIPNVNDFTFGVYKTLVDIGSNYKTSVAFIMHPAITRIVREYNKGKSLYTEESVKPIQEALRTLAEDAGIDTSGIYTTKSLIKALNEKFSRNYSISKNNKIILDATELAYEVKLGEDVSLDRQYDIIMAYNDINRVSQNIQKLVTVCNPDRFGAKQTIFATNNVFRKIAKYSQTKSAKMLTINGQPFLKAMYPGLIDDRGRIDKIGYLKNIEQGAYGSLNSFLKWSSVTSTFINSMIFDTQRTDFINEVLGLQKAFGVNRDITEDEYNDFENYIIADAAVNTIAMQKAYTISSLTGRVEFINRTDTQERIRIYGYNRPQVVSFKVKDIVHPTQAEIDAWSNLSPAQKVAWLQANTEERGIFDFIAVDLYDNYKVGNKEYPAQSIRFKEDSIDTETAYTLFEDIATSSNPLIKLTAMDLIKYAFVIEGNKIRRGAINKLIKNSILRNDDMFTDEIGNPLSLMSQIRSNMNVITDRDLTEDYVRSHSDAKFIPHKEIKKERKGRIWVNQLNMDAVHGYLIELDVPVNMSEAEAAQAYEDSLNDSEINEDVETEEENIENKEENKEDAAKQEEEKNLLAKQKNDTKLAKKYGLFDINTEHDTPYVVFNFKIGKKSYSALFKTERRGNKLFAYPLNKLDSNEHSLFSINPTNDELKFPSPVYYKAIIDDKFNITPTITDEDNDNMKQYYRSDVHIAKAKKVNQFNIQEDAKKGIYGANKVIEKITNAIMQGNNHNIQFNNIYLADKLGYHLSAPQTITTVVKTTDINGNEVTQEITKQYRFHKLHTEFNGKRTGWTSTSIEAIPYEPKDTSSKNKNTNSNSKAEVLNSSTTEYEFDTYKDISRRSKEGDVLAYREINHLKELGFTELKEDFSKYQNDTYDSIARYTKAKVNQLIDTANQFIKGEDGHWISIFDPKAIDIIKLDPVQQRRFNKLLLDVKAIQQKYSAIYDVIEDSDTPVEVKDYIKSIKDSLKNLNDNINVSELNAKFAREVVAKWSDDPKIQNGLVDVLNGYHATSWADAWIGDLQDSGNSMVQIITKHIMSDIRGKEMMAKKNADDFVKHIQSIAKKGTVDWNKLVDKYGKLIRPYNDKFENDLKELKTNVEIARKNIDSDPLGYLEAKHKYDLFKLNYINRPIVDEYYKKLYELDDEMMNHASYKYILAEYIKLREKLNDINKRRDNGKLDDELAKEYKEISKKINSLKSDYDFDTFELKQTYSPENPMPGIKYYPDGSEKIEDKEKFISAILNSRHCANALRSYINKLNEINAEYIDIKAKDEFEETLDRMLDIINDAEQRDDSGYKTVSDTVLNNDEKYQRAKAWLASNAIWKVDKKVSDAISWAYNILANGKPKQNSRIVTRKSLLIQKKLADGVKVYDEEGRIIGDIFTEEEQKSIQEDEQGRYKNTMYAAGNEQYLISNAPENRKVYPRIVYNMLTTNNAIPNTEYLKLVEEINNILRPYYDTIQKKVNMVTESDRISEDDLRKLAKLYDKLRETKKTIVPEGMPGKGKSVASFIKNFMIHDDRAYNKEKFDADYALAKNIGGEYLRLWEEVNMEYEPLLDSEGFVVKDSDGNMLYDLTKRHPNRFLYGNLVLDEDKFFGLIKSKTKRKELEQEMRDKNRALRIINEYLEQTRTPYYVKAMKEARSKGEDYFKEWYERNHIWNPYKHSYEPTGIWQKTSVVPDYANGKWKPNYAQQVKTPKKEYENSAYKGTGSSNLSNYKTDAVDDTYTNKTELNDAEKETLEYVKTTLNKLVHDQRSKRYIDEGYLPNAQALAQQDLKWFVKQVGEFFGWSDYGNKIGNKDLLDHMNYTTDFTPAMPMLIKQLKTKASIDVEEIKRNTPRKEDYSTDEEFNKAFEEHKKRLEEAEKINEQIHVENLNRNFVENIATFISLAGHFNAVQDNKYLFYYLQDMVGTQEVLESNLGYKGLRKDTSKSTKDVTAYHKEIDERLYKQLSNWGSRLLFDSYKMPNAKITKGMNIVQSLTSAKFMMLNIIGGIENITVGRSAIFGEHIAKQFVGNANWEKGKSMWYKNSLSFIRGLYSETSTTLADAIIKAMNVVDFDEVTGRPKGNFDSHNAIERLRDFMYSPNAMGEHMMQNGMMFAMLYDCKLIEVEDYKSKGRLPYRIMNLFQYTEQLHEQAMKELLAGTPLAIKFEKFIESIKSDENKLKDYARNRKDIATEFANIYLNNSKKKEFYAKRKELETKAKEKFDTLPSIMEQLDLVDGKLGFKNGSKMQELSTTSTFGELNDAYALLGEFKGRVIATNKEIHGVYDRLGAAQLEKYWFGSLITQYHKHIYPGILKHWRKKGYFNEELGANEIGCGPALYDFITMPIRQYNDRKKMLTDEELNALEGTQSLFKAYINFAENLRLNWNTLPGYQRAAILRATGDIFGALAAICIAIGTRIIWDDDELKENMFANLMLREADGLATQSMMFNPLFLPSQAKTLWSSPIAGLNGPKDIYDALNVISQSIMDDDFDWNYSTGRYKGENKFAVRIKRQIPIYRQWSNMTGLSKSNSYYNMGEHILSVIPVKSIAEDLR